MNKREFSLSVAGQNERKIRIEEESVFPDYSSDIVRVIRADALPVITSKKVYIKEGSAFVEVAGRVDMTVVYSGDEGSLESHSFSADFSDNARYPLSEDIDFDSVVITVLPLAEGVVCKAQNQRKVSVRCDLVLSTEVMGNRAFEVFSADGSENIEKRDTEVTSAVTAGLISEEFEFSEEIKLFAGAPPIDRLISTRAKIFPESISASNGKINIKALLSVFALYLPESEREGTARAESFYQPIEVSASVEGEDVSPDSAVTALFSPVFIRGEILPDNFGENRILKVSGSYKGDFTVIENESITLTEDAYAQGGTFSGKTDSERFSRYFGNLREEIAVRERIPLKTSLRRLEDGYGEIKLKGWGFDNGKLYTDCKVTFTAVGVGDDADAPVSEAFDLHLKLNLPSELDKVKDNIEPRFSLSTGFIDCKTEEGECEISFDVIVSADVFVEEKSTFLTSGEAVFEEREEENIFAYPSPDDTLWTLGKRYAVSQSELEKKNGITDGSLKRVMKI